MAILGSGGDKTARDRQAAESAGKFAGGSVEKGFSISTGGYSGVMKAATEAAAEKARQMGVNPKDRVFAYPMKDAKVFAELEVKDDDAEKIRSDSVTKRLTGLVGESSAFVVFGGGFGSLTEVLTALEEERIKKKITPEKPSRPVILIDPSLKHTDTLSQLARAEKKLRDPAITESLYILSHNPEAEKIAQEILEQHYQASVGNKPAEGELQKYSAYNLKNFLRNQENFQEGSGI